MLPTLDDTHLAVCIAVSKLFETSPEHRNHSQAFGCCQSCLPCMTDLVLPRLQTKQQSLSATLSIKTHNRCCPKLSDTLYKSYRVHGALLLGCIGVGCCPMALVGCTQTATDTTGLLQRMLPTLDVIHLAVCIAVSKPFQTSPENRNQSQAFGCRQSCLPCMTDLVLPRLHTKQQSLSATFSLKTYTPCISKAFQHFVENLIGCTKLCC